MRFEEFQQECLSSYDVSSSQRLGQWCFNKLYDTQPELADRIRGSVFSDPFYDDANLRTFWFVVRTQGKWDDGGLA